MRSIRIAVTLSSLMLVPSALAAAPAHPGVAGAKNGPSATGAASATPAVSRPSCGRASARAKQVSYVLRGTLSDYTAATPAAAGGVTIKVLAGNCIARTFIGTSLTFALAPATRVHARSISDGDRGALVVRGAKQLDATALAKLVPRLVSDRFAETRTS
jgi:hypothetical protein